MTRPADDHLPHLCTGPAAREGAAPTEPPRGTGVWFRRDLRTADHAPLLAAAARGPVTCVYCVDPRDFGPTAERGFERTGPFRAPFLLESLADLRARLRALGGELVVRRGRPEHVLPELARSLGWTTLAYHALVGTEERAVEAAVEAALAGTPCRTTAAWDLTLLDPADLPFEVADTPASFTPFRRAVERASGFRAPLPEPTALVAASPELDPGPLPTLDELGLEDVPRDERGALEFVGGQTAGEERLARYFWAADGPRRYKETRDGMIGEGYSTKLSPWLAHGCLSTRRVQAEVERYEAQRVRNESTGWITFELLWRDWFQLLLAARGVHVFRPSGLQGRRVPWKRDAGAFEAWRLGRTGFPIVDASLRELLHTGYMSNRGRQIVASFLTKNLGLDWRWGAEWFESRLVDHDVASNYGNWNYAAGVGGDGRGFRYFDPAQQAARYDPEGRHARLWCPELERSPDEYPAPLVDLEASLRANRAAWGSAPRG